MTPLHFPFAFGAGMLTVALSACLPNPAQGAVDSAFEKTDTVPVNVVSALPEEEADTASILNILDNILAPDVTLLTSKDGATVKSRRTNDVKTDSLLRYSGLSEEDFTTVADELGVEVAAIKAVVLIEAGSEMKGFWAPGVPVVNFENSMFQRYRSKVAGKGDKDEKVPHGLKGYGLKEWTQLVNARKINVAAANMGTFWGMFQIGGFNYKRCGCETIEEFVDRMSYSEFEQLELFASFITNCGMLDDLRKKNWAGFARKYNGAGYARRGYHTRMASAYKRIKALMNE